MAKKESSVRVEQCVKEFGIGVAADDRDMFSSRIRLLFDRGCEVEVVNETASAKTIRVPLVTGVDMTIEVPKVNLK
jgi:hypothetical protein